MINTYKGKKVLVLGLGLNQGGVGAAKFFAKNGAFVRVTDLKSEQVLKPSIDLLKDFQIEYALGEHKNEDIDWADLIVKNPAIKPGNPYIGYALKKRKKVEQDMGIFLQFVKPSRIIGITGTKGKSTTALLIYEVLQKSRGSSVTNPWGWLASNPWKIVLAGNIGKSVLETIEYIDKNTLVVLELSSFQLEAFEQHKISPKWAVITNITPDHLNYYTTMDEYIEAKKIIGKYQTPSDYLFINKDDPITSQNNFLDGLNGQVCFFSKDDLPKSFDPHLKGEHNLENMAAAYQIGKVFNINSDLMLKTLSDFKGVPFRMELIKEWNGVKIYNDTTATDPDAGIKALKTLGANVNSPLGCLILICGGMNKNMPYYEYAKAVEKYAKKVFFLEGDSTEVIKRLIIKKDLIAGAYNDLEKLLLDVKNIVEDGNVILFSPAATSFNLFQNEFDRGRKFNDAVEKIFQS